MELLTTNTDQAQREYDRAFAGLADDDARANLSAMRHYGQGYAAARFEAMDGIFFSRPDAALAFGYLYAAYKANGGALLINDLFDACEHE
jgi:hypothetical protein